MISKTNYGDKKLSNLPINQFNSVRYFYNISDPSRVATKPKDTGTILPIQPLIIFGLKIYFDSVKFQLCDEKYSLDELLAICHNLKESFLTINEKGFVKPDQLTNPVFSTIEDYISGLGFKIKNGLGSNQNTYTL